MGRPGVGSHARRMTTAIEEYPAGAADVTASRAADHLWMHFARQGRHPETPVPVVTRGEGAYIWDNRGRRSSTASPGCSSCRSATEARDLAEAAARAGGRAGVLPAVGLHHTRAGRAGRAGRRAGPGDLNRVFFTTGGGEAVESAWKAAKQYFKLIGKPLKTR